jgi:hypothetical protein
MKRWAPAIGLVAAVLALAGCGADDSKTIKFGFESPEQQGTMGKRWQPGLVLGAAHPGSDPARQR